MTNRGSPGGMSPNVHNNKANFSICATSAGVSELNDPGGGSTENSDMSFLRDNTDGDAACTT